MRKFSRVVTKRAVHDTVAGLLARSDAVQQMPRAGRESLSHDLIEVAMLAADQLADELILTDEIRRGATTRPGVHGPFVRAQAALEPSMAATAAVGDTVRSIKSAIDFPTYVTSLLTGVFQAITTSNIQQIEAIADLLENVSASSSEFSSKNITVFDAANWAVGRFSFLRRSDAAEGGTLLELRPDVDLMDHSAELKSALRLTDTEAGSIEEDRLDATLLPLVRRAMGRDKQSNLATLVMMGVNRVLVDKGQLHASMDMRVDTRSAAETTERSRFDHRTNVGMSAAGVGMGWGVAAQTSTSIGQVMDNQSASNEEISSQAGLRSSVDLVFHTEPIDLDQMLAHEQRKAIIANSRVPEAKYTTGTILTDQKSKTGIANLGAIPDAPKAPAVPDLTKLAQVMPSGGGQGGGERGGSGDDAGGDTDDDGVGGDTDGDVDDALGNLGSRGTTAYLEHEHFPTVRVRRR